MKIPLNTNRRKVLKTLGGGVVGGTVLSGTASATDTDDDGDILLKTVSSGEHDFKPDTYHTAPDSVTWKHDDHVEHNVHIEERPNGGTQIMSSGAMAEGDEYTVYFSLEDNGNTLRLTDNNQSKTIDVSDAGDSIELGVLCDFHGGQVGIMEMEEFVVNL